MLIPHGTGGLTMYDYPELVERLRAGTYTVEELSIILPKAADAIERLSAYVRQIEELRKDGYYLQKTEMMTYGQATMTMPLPEPPEEET
jgi:hypothetical protein